MNSQNILKEEQRVKTYVDLNGETRISFLLTDAKIILNDLLVSELNDSILKKYETSISLQDSIIFTYKQELNFTNLKLKNVEYKYKNQIKITENKDKQIDLLNNTIAQQKKIIKKLKIEKGVIIGTITVTTSLAIIGGIMLLLQQ